MSGLDGWQLVHLRHLASDASAMCAAIEQSLEGVDLDSLRTGGNIVVSADACSETVDGVLALHDLADAMEHIAGAFRIRNDTLVVSAQELELEAAAALAHGSADPAHITLAARMLAPREGFAGRSDRDRPGHHRTMERTDGRRTARRLPRQHAGPPRGRV